MVLKRVLTNVDFPKPDSPEGGQGEDERSGEQRGRTDDHYGELETLPDTLAVDLVWKVRETDVTHEFLADNGVDGMEVVRKGRTGTI